MTGTLRALIVLAVLVGATVLAIVERTQVAVVIGLYGTVLGYVLRAGEQGVSTARKYLDAARRAAPPRSTEG